MSFSSLSLFGRVSPRSRANLTRQLAIIISSGLPVATALQMVSQQTGEPRLKAALIVMTRDVEQGQAFSAAAARFPELFSEVMIAMLRSGEASGQLETVFPQIAEIAEKQLDLLTRLRNALIYPAFVAVVVVIVAIITTVVIIPRLTEVFDALAGDLPWSTRILIASSRIVLNYWYIILAVGGATIFFLQAYLRTDDGREVIYLLERQVPLVRDYAANVQLVRFAMIFSMLIRAGVTLPEALRLVGTTATTPAWSRAFGNVRREVERGVGLAAAMSRHDVFPKNLTQMVAVGEQTGTLVKVLETLAVAYEEQMNNDLKALTSLLEPTIILIVAMGVGFVVISIILPIYRVAQYL